MIIKFTESVFLEMMYLEVFLVAEATEDAVPEAEETGVSGVVISALK